MHDREILSTRNSTRYSSLQFTPLRRYVLLLFRQQQPQHVRPNPHRELLHRGQQPTPLEKDLSGCSTSIALWIGQFCRTNRQTQRGDTT